MAKMKALKELRSAMSGMEGEGLGKALSVKKVTVAAPDSEKLKEGLDKAKDMVEEMPDDQGPTEESEEGQHDGHEYKSMNDMEESEESEEDMSPEEIDKRIAELQKLKASKV
jgi:hypothetical protein